MCRELEALRQSMQAYSRSFDARSLTPAQAREILRRCSQIKACVTTVESLAAAVAAEASTYKTEGYRSPEEQLARQAGMSPTQARRALATGRRMLDQPEVAAAAPSGELSPEQTAAVSAGAEANPARTGELIRLARQVSMPELNEAVARTRAEAVDLEARRRAIHARRNLSRFTDPEGVYHAYLSGNPEDGITIDQVITEIRRQLTLNRRERQIPNETMAALDYDAMCTLFDLARGKDCDVTLTQLLDIGLFPQLHHLTTTADPARSANPAGSTGPSGSGPSGTSTPAGPTAPTGPSCSSGPSGTNASSGRSGTNAPTDPAGSSAPDGCGPGAVPHGATGSPAAPKSTAPDLFSVLTDDPPPPADTTGPPASGPAPARHPDGRPATRQRLPGRPARIIVRIDLDTFLRGYPLDGELCDIPGYGPVPISMIRDLIESGQTRLAFVLTKSREVRSVYLARRHPNEYQKTALDWLYPVCAVKGCNTRAGLQADHRTDWAMTHYTVLDLLDYLCWHHHNLKTTQGWALVPGHGKRDFVPPDDPRHPRHHPQPAGPETASPASHKTVAGTSPDSEVPTGAGPPPRAAATPHRTRGNQQTMLSAPWTDRPAAPPNRTSSS